MKNANDQMTALRDALAHILGSDGITVDAGVVSAHAGDWSEAPKVEPRMVLFPKTPAQVAAALGTISRFGQRVTVQGGLTGLAGGATPCDGEIALSLSKLNRIEALDDISGTVTVQAGVPLETLQSYVAAHDWLFALDLGARGTCQLGGNAATNAGGNRVIRYGTMRDLVLGIEVALADGTLIPMMNQVTKNTTGVDLKQLFIGSEGMLGVITRLVLKLVPRPTVANTALCALSSFDHAARLLKEMRKHLPTLSSFELMWNDFMTTAIDTAQLRPPFAQAHPVYVLVETLGADSQRERETLERCLEQAIETALVTDVVVAESIDHARRLWAYREAIGEILSRLQPHAAFDVGIPMSAMDRFVSAVRNTLNDVFPQQHHLFFGHIGDGNLHVLSGPYDTSAALHRVEQIVYVAVRDAGGCISAEHGIGVIKKAFLPLSRCPDELSLMRSLKTLFDPNGTLNAGRIVDMRPH
ncbi:FAD-binding oxidoreductase [Pandoraea sp.]|uniref:FAD-binding oxidoreductase n=1 Tax=Pandoraea sp. TaxID=1883445 RepID=UPI00121E5A76|nr:FAD-binding oxidoreductase [Pandoraea sp.]TAL54672.1 MAG: FAD-binding oxidoreductase [Pandoraea sp.]TAM18560.1 MAG: FAD-binding oxidoreductase [Pandoraea sp.]